MPKILYVDDTPQNLLLVRKILEKEADITLIEADTGQKGIDLALQERPDLIILDIDLPDMLGYQVATTLKAQIEVTIVALTGNNQHGDREKALEAGCDGYLPKPISRNNLLKTLEEFL
jgi:two-component system cell cycle response regulator DivK